MREERRIKTLQKIVERLKVENQQLLTENKRIKELKFEYKKKMNKIIKSIKRDFDVK